MNEAFSFIAENPAPFIISVVIFAVVVSAIFLIRWMRKKKQKPLGASAMADLKTKTGEPQKKTELETGGKSKEEVAIIEGGIVKEQLEIGPQFPYKAIIRWYPKPGRTPVIEFGNKISKPLGDPIFCEPSCPATGDAYYVVQNKDGSFSPYDPRAAAILSEKTPYMAWDAVHWPEAEGVWVFTRNWMEKISSIMMWAAFAAMILIVLVKIGG